MKFIDQAKIFLRSGAGGDGCIAFRREKYIPRGGPAGGDGGRGGHVYFQAVEGLNTLIDFRYRQHFKAAKGGNGEGSNRHGKHAEDVIIKVPAGTQILDEHGEALLMDLTEPGEPVLFLKGGDGGFGNSRFATSTNRAPRKALKGWPGEECWVWLHLKLLADAGLVGLPNAGKSTFLKTVSAAQPKIADYPFTTLIPQLGVVEVSREPGAARFVLADIPGLIEGASEGKGLGDRFLGHIERTKVLLHLVDAAADDPVADYETVCTELESYGAGLKDKKAVLALSRVDALDEETLAEKQAALAAASDREVHLLSAVAGRGVSGVVQAVWHAIEAARADDVQAAQVRLEESGPETAGRSPELEELANATDDIGDAGDI